MNNHLKVINAGLSREYYYKQSDEVGFSGWSPILFQEGQGNISASIKMLSENTAVVENEDKSAAAQPIFYAETRECKFPVSQVEWATIKDGIKKKFTTVVEGVTTSWYIDELKLSKENEATVKLIRVNENFI